MPSTTPIQRLEEEERRARVRLSAFRSRLYRRDFASPRATRLRMDRLERQWRTASERLSRARRAMRHGDPNS